MLKLDEFVLNILHLAQNIVGGSTVFVSKFHRDKFIISKMLNSKGIKLFEGQEFELIEALCKNVFVGNGYEPLLIQDAASDRRAPDLFTMEDFHIGSFVSVPIVLNDGRMYATLCPANPNPHTLGMKEVEEMEKLAFLLAGVIETANSNQLAEEEQIRSKSLEVIRDLVADVADEIGNPLQILKGFYQLSEHDVDAMKNYHQLLEDELNKIENKLQEILIQTSPTYPMKRNVNVMHVIGDTLQHIQEDIDAAIQFEVTMTPPIPKGNLDDGQISYMLKNLIINAAEAIENEKGCIRISCYASDNDLFIEIEDNGTGIPLADLEKVSQPFYTSKKKGRGLGLTIVHQILQGHEGEIMIDSKQTGTKVMLRLPLDHKTQPVLQF